MEHIKKHFQLTSKQNTGSAVMEGRSKFHTEVPTFQAEIQDVMSRLNVYYEVLGHLCGAGTHVGERFVDILRGTQYMEVAMQLNSLAVDINTCTLATLQNVKELSRSLLQDLVIMLEKTNKNDKSETSIQIVAKCMAMLMQIQCQAFMDVSTKMQQLHSKVETKDFLAQYNLSTFNQGANCQQSNIYNQSTPTCQNNTQMYRRGESYNCDGNRTVPKYKENPKNNNVKLNNCETSSQRKDSGSLASEEELNSVIGLLSCGPREVGVSPHVNRPVNLPAVSISLPPPPLPDTPFNVPPPSKPNTDMYQRTNVSPWPVPLQHRSSFPLMSTPSIAKQEQMDYNAQNKVIGSQLGVSSLWAGNDVNLHHSWPRQKPGRDWSTLQDSKDSSSDESSSNGDSYFALALGADLSSDITGVSPRRRHSSSGDETPRAEQPEMLLNRPRSTESFHLEAKSTNTWPPKQPWVRQQMANQMVEMMSGDQSNLPMGPTPWNEVGPPQYGGPVWMQGYQEAANVMPYPVGGNNNMKHPLSTNNYSHHHNVNQYTPKDK